MLSYGFSIRGKSHIENGTLCQDANSIAEVSPGLYLAIAADGVGSALHSDIASNMAVEKLTEYVKKNISPDASVEEKKKVLSGGYEHAEIAIEKYAESCGETMRDYDTTLHSVLYDGKKVIYGHAGDGGIIIRTMKGKTLSVTDPQKGTDGVSVMPLRAGSNSWEFGYFVEDVSSVMLVTDGILERVVMPYLLNLPDTRANIHNSHRKKNRVYLSATEFFMNPYCVMGNRKITDPQETYRYFITAQFSDASKDWDTYLSCLKAGYRNLYGSKKAEQICESLTASVPLWNLEDTTDDKTIVCLMNEAASIYAPDISYFMEPDWAKLRSHYEELLYPADGKLNGAVLWQPETEIDEEEASKKESVGILKSLFGQKD